MTDVGIRTYLTFYGDCKDESWPFPTKVGEHTWEGHRLPAVPAMGTMMHFAKFPDDKKRAWEVFSVTWVYDEVPPLQTLGEKDRWHLEIALR